MGAGSHYPLTNGVFWLAASFVGTLFMLLGALPLAAELHKRRLSLLHSVVSSENECLKGLVQRQLACSFNIQNSFFFIVSNILEKYGLPSLSQLSVATTVDFNGSIYMLKP